jgi:hypothetical protein
MAAPLFLMILITRSRITHPVLTFLQRYHNYLVPIGFKPSQAPLRGRRVPASQGCTP